MHALCQAPTYPDGLFDQVGRVTLELHLELVHGTLSLLASGLHPHAIQPHLIALDRLVPGYSERTRVLSRLDGRDGLAVEVEGLLVERDVERRLLDGRQGLRKRWTSESGGRVGDVQEAVDLATTCR